MRHPPRIVLGITSGIAAYKTPALIRLLRKQGVAVRVVLTPHARAFVGEESLRTVSDNPVSYDGAPVPTGTSRVYDEMLEHIRLAQWGEYCLVAPATANTLAKLAHGIADNLLTTVALCFDGPRLIVAPAMNTGMWQNKATKDNVALLERRGVHVLPVESGELACGDDGAGRMLSIEEIAQRVSTLTGPRLLAGKRVLISSGPTAEPVDSVRVITNRSSGKMGAALARAALALGAQVTVVTGPARVSPPAGARAVHVNTAEQMRAALVAEYRDADACILAAAVADFTVKNPLAGKIDRRASGEITITLVPTPDIAAELGRLKKRQLLVGFALETGDGQQRARTKMLAKNCDLMVLNHPETALETDTTRVTLLSRAGKPVRLKIMTKDEAATQIMQRIASRLGARR